MSVNLPAVIEAAAKGQGLVPADVNLMLPSETYGAVLGSFDKISLEVIRIDPDPRAGDVFEPGKKGLFALGKVPLERIANALSIQWHPQTGIVESTATKSRAKAIGIMRKPNGETIVQTDEKTIDLTVIEDEAREKAEKDAEGGKILSWENNRPIKEPWKSDAERKEYIEREVRKAVMQKRKFKDELAVTGAKDRVIRAFIATKSTYTAAELSKPFAFPRVSLDTSKMLADPAMRSAAIGLMGGATSTLFGPQGAAEPEIKPALPAPEETRDVTGSVAVVEDDDPFGPVGDEDKGAKAETTIDPKVTAARAALMDWANYLDEPAVGKAAEAILGRDETDLEVLEVSIEILKYMAAKCLKPAGFTACSDALRNAPRDLIVLRDIAGKARQAYDARITKKAS